MHLHEDFPSNPDKLYPLLIQQLQAITDNVPHKIANLANTSALLWEALDNLNWVGFYLREGDTLILGPFQGKVACIEIPMGRGVCGTAAARGETVRVEDVHAFPGHIACDSASNSEIVIPLFRNGEVVGVLDIDSPILARFTPEDQIGLEAVARVIESFL
jgi:GAF domain-containing protein